jgi:hypothetical protein
MNHRQWLIGWEFAHQVILSLDLIDNGHQFGLTYLSVVATIWLQNAGMWTKQTDVAGSSRTRDPTNYAPTNYAPQMEIGL